ncbi:MAG: signal peptidase II [Rhodospirillales bacterium]|nr:signal peptidase II [Rhodospirillales bacterium]
MTRQRLGSVAALLVLAADQASKAWILYGLNLPVRQDVPLFWWLDLTMVWNHGITFGIFNGESRVGSWILIVVALVVVALLWGWLRRAESLLAAAALGAIAGGAIGNILDRLRFGAVVDFIHAHAFGYSWYVFNIADAAIVCGVGVLVLDGLRRREHGAAGKDAQGGA